MFHLIYREPWLSHIIKFMSSRAFIISVLIYLRNFRDTRHLKQMRLVCLNSIRQQTGIRFFCQEMLKLVWLIKLYFFCFFCKGALANVMPLVIFSRKFTSLQLLSSVVIFLERTTPCLGLNF